MSQPDPCKECRSRDTCRQVVRKIGHSPGPPVTRQVVVAFGIPLLVFIDGFAAAEGALRNMTAHGAWATWLAAGIGLGLAALAVAVGRAWLRRQKDKDERSIRTG